MVLPKPIWKDIKGFEGKYQVNQLGQIRSLNYRGHEKTKRLKPRDSRDYLVVALYKDGKRKNFKIHRLVAHAFIPNPNNLPQVNHKDENKENNCVWNLEWCTNRYNNNYGTKNERASNKFKKKIICIETGIVYNSITEASQELCCDKSNIGKCLRGKQNTAKGFHWEYYTGD